MQEITNKRRLQLKTLQKILRIKFTNIALLDRALTHRSYGNEQKTRCSNYERLEFLGDSVLGFITACKYPELDEGNYSQIKAVVVSENSLSKIAKTLHFGDYILIGHGEECNGGRDKKPILEDTFEAVIGAYYLDCKSMARVKNFVLRFIADEIEAVIENRHEKDYKTLLQEMCQKKNNSCPIYKVVNEEGPEHNKKFTVCVIVNGKSLSEGFGSSKKDAEKEAAERAYRRLTTTVETKTSHNNNDAKKNLQKTKKVVEKQKITENKVVNEIKTEEQPKKFYENIDFASIRKNKSQEKTKITKKVHKKDKGDKAK